MNGRMARRLRKAASFLSRSKRDYRVTGSGAVYATGTREMYQAMKCAAVAAAVRRAR